MSDESSLRSESVYLDLLRRGAGGAFIGTMHRFADGRIFTDEHLSPRLSVGRYEQLAFDFVAYDPAQTPAAVSIFENDTLTQDVSVPRTTQRYANRFSAQGAVTLRFLCRGVEYVLPVTVEPSDIDIEETTADPSAAALGRGPFECRGRSCDVELRRCAEHVRGLRLEQQRLDGRCAADAQRRPRGDRDAAVRRGRDVDGRYLRVRAALLECHGS